MIGVVDKSRGISFVYLNHSHAIVTERHSSKVNSVVEVTSLSHESHLRQHRCQDGQLPNRGREP